MVRRARKPLRRHRGDRGRRAPAAGVAAAVRDVIAGATDVALVGDRAVRGEGERRERGGGGGPALPGSAPAGPRRLRTSRRRSAASPSTAAAETWWASTRTRESTAQRATSSKTRASRSSGSRRVDVPASARASSTRASTSVHRTGRLEQLADQLARGARLGLGRRHLEPGPERGQRALKVVRRVGYEGPLQLCRRVEPGPHRVQRPG